MSWASAGFRSVHVRVWYGNPKMRRRIHRGYSVPMAGGGGGGGDFTFRELLRHPWAPARYPEPDYMAPGFPNHAEYPVLKTAFTF